MNRTINITHNFNLLNLFGIGILGSCYHYGYNYIYNKPPVPNNKIFPITLKKDDEEK